MWRLLLVVLGLVMAANGYAVTAITTAVTTTSVSYVDVTGASISAAQLDAAGIAVGQKCLLYVTGQVSQSAGGNTMAVKARHGTTDFAESITSMAWPGGAFRGVYGFLTVWTRVSGETLSLQWLVSAGTGTINFIEMMALNLSDDLTENTHWHFAERATDDSLSTTFLDGAALSFTPAAGRDWAVLNYSLAAHLDGAVSIISRIGSTGTIAESVPSARSERVSGRITAMLLQRVFPDLAASTQTFTEQAALSAAGTGTRQHSAIFALDLDAFKNHEFVWTAADANLSATNYATNLATISITPTVQSDVWIGAYWGFDLNNTGREAETRIQVDNVDAPAGQTTANYQFIMTGDATDEQPLPMTALVAAMTAAAHTIDLDASADSATAAPAGQHRSLWAFTMELAAVAAALPGKPAIIQQAVHRAASY